MKVHPIGQRELWLALCTLFVAILLQTFVWGINPELTYGPHGLMVTMEVALAVVLFLMAGRRHLRPSRLYKLLSFIFLGVISLANVTSFFLVARLLITDSSALSGRELVASAIAIFLTNIIVFALWYWEIDSPGLTGRKWSKHDKDFQFTQQDMAKDFPDWQPSFIDYLYLSTTNGINFAPADTRPVTSQAKCLMGAQALISVFTLALILSRSISILS